MLIIPTDTNAVEAIDTIKLNVVGVVLCGPGRAEQVVQAMNSAPWCNHYVLVQPNQAGAEQTTGAAIAAAYGPTTVVPVEWDGFSVARQAGHDAAEALDADWIVTIDTDQVLNFPNARLVLHRALKEGYTVICVNDGNACRERIIAGGTACKWIGRIHEYPEITPYVRLEPEGWSLYEHGKDDAASQDQQRRYLELLEKECKGPDPLGRNHFYLARTQQFLGIDSRKATQIAFDTSIAPEQAALAAYDYALVKDSAEWCGKALGKFPLAEAAWLLASIYYRHGERDKAETWAMIALTMLGHPRTVFNVRGDLFEKCSAILIELKSAYAPR